MPYMANLIVGRWIREVGIEKIYWPVLQTDLASEISHLCGSMRELCAETMPDDDQIVRSSKKRRLSEAYEQLFEQKLHDTPHR